MVQSKKLWWAALLVCSSFFEAGAQVAWTLRNPSTALKTVQGVTWTGTLAVAVGDSGSISTSPNGSLWTTRNSGAPTNAALIAVTSGGGNMVALGAASTIRRSTDGGITWVPVTTIAPPSAATINGVAYCGNKFVAVGSGGTILTSVDGSSWTSQVVTAVTNTTWRSIAWNGTFALAVGDGGALATSVDGVSWSPRVWTGIAATVSMYSVTWADGKFVAVGNAGEIRSSAGTAPEALTWTKHTPTSSVTTYLNSVVWTGSVFVAVGGAGTIVTSTDGAVWNVATSGAGATDIFRAVTWTATRFLAVGNIAGNVGLVRTSTNGTSWGSTALTNANLWGATWATGKPRVVVGDAGNTLVSTADTGWVMRPTGASQSLYGVTWAGNQVVAVGAAGAVFTSADGDVWAVKPVSGVTEILNSVAWNGATMVAVGASARIISSTNGSDWTIRTPTGVTGTPTLYSVAWCGTKFVAVGGGGTVFTSTNGTTWALSTVGLSATATYRTVVYTGSQMVMMGAGGVVLTSNDGIAWTTRSSGVSIAFNSVSWNGSALVAVGPTGTVLTSVDTGVTWIPQTSATTSSLNSVTSTADGWMIVGVAGALQTSPVALLPGIPNPTSPAHASTGISVYGPLAWSAVSGATSYRVQLSADSNFAGLIVNDTLTGTSKALSALNSNTLYYWRVRAQSQLGGGAWSPTRRFTTGLAPTTAPSIPILVAPQLFATDVTIPATLVWNVANGAESYYVQISTGYSFSSYVLRDSTITVLSRALGGLEGGVEYFWRVRAKNGFGSSDWSETWSFRTVLAVPAAPLLISPAAFLTNVDRAPQLKWETVAAAVKYHVQIALDGGFATVVAHDSSGLGTTFTPPTLLAANADHYWRVRARNDAGWGPYSDIRRFTTGAISALLPGQKMSQFFRTGEGRYLRFSLLNAEPVQIRLFDMQGRLAMAVLNEIQSAGEHTVALPARLPESLYMLEFRVGARREWLRVHP